MMAAPVTRRTGQARMYEEFLAVHTIMRRGTALVSESFERLVAGEPVDVKVLVGAARWLIEFAHRHQVSEDGQFWPVLRDRFPEAVAELDRVTAEHPAIDVELHALSRAVDAIDTPRLPGEREAVLVVVGQAVLSGLPALQGVQALLTRRFEEEEPVLLDLFPKVPDEDVPRLREAIVDGAPHVGPHLVFGLMEDPGPIPGYEVMTGNFPMPVRWMRPVLLARYRAIKKALGARDQFR